MARIMFKDVEQFFNANGYNIEKMEKSRHYMVSKEKEDGVHIYANMTLGNLKEEAVKNGVEKVLETYNVENIEAKKTVAPKKEKKETSKKKKTSKSKITELEERKINLTLQILAIKKRGSSEHLALRQQLHEVHNEVQNLM